MEINILSENLIELKFQEIIFNIKLRVFNKNTSLEINITSESEFKSIPIRVSDAYDEIIIDVLEINNKNIIKKLIIKNKQENGDNVAEDVLLNIKNIFGNIETSVSEIDNVEKVFNNFGNGLSSMLSNTSNTQLQQNTSNLQQKENENNLNWNIKKKSR